MSTECELISIIIPVYNVENYLPRCLETIAAQTYRNLEIILVDDGSTDRSGSICDEFAKKDYRAWVIHQQNMGQSGARNRGKEVASGEYIMFVDGDDYLHVDAVNTLWAAIKSDLKYDIAISRFKKTDRLDEDCHSQGGSPSVIVTQGELIKSMMVNRKPDETLHYIVLWNKLYRKEVIRDIYFEDWRLSEDLDFNFKAYLNVRKAIFLNRELYYYVQRPSSITHSVNNLDRWYDTHTAMFYALYEKLAERNIKEYQNLPLQALYRKMALWKGRTYQKENMDEVYQKCRQYECSTRWAYWLNWRINPIEKIGVTTLLHCPRLTRWLLIKTKNW